MLPDPHIALDIFERYIFIDTVGFEKTIQADAGQPPQLTRLSLRDPARPQFLKREGFQRPAL